MIIIKTEREIDLMRKAGSILAGAFELAEPLMIPGMNAAEIDRAIDDHIRAHGGIPSFKNYPNADGVPFPAAICLSIEAEVVHGIPGTRILQAGTLVGLDIGVQFGGYHADAARTYGIGKLDRPRQKLLDVTRTALSLGLKQARAGNHLSNIGHAVQTYVEAQGCSVVRDLVGHGVGKNLHEDPQIPNYGSPRRGPILRKNMTLAIEPMINLGGYEVEMIGDWQILTRDRKPSAHFEHTVVITDGEPEILTATSVLH
jgi:methionyl aminopeptidase